MKPPGGNQAQIFAINVYVLPFLVVAKLQKNFVQDFETKLKNFHHQTYSDSGNDNHERRFYTF